MTAFGKFLPVGATKCAGQSRCKRLISRMQMGGQIGAISRLHRRSSILFYCSTQGAGLCVPRIPRERLE